MNEESYIIINKLKKDIERIISAYETVAAENRLLKEELSTAQNELESNKTNIKELKRKIEKLQLTEAFRASAQDVKEAKQKIGKLVKEIDKCISLLND